MPEPGNDFELERPPLDEMVLGIQFVPLAGWSVPHFGLFWETIRQDFPHFEVKEPLITPESLLSAPGSLVVSGLPARMWFIEESGVHLLQIQHDRVVLNWRKRPGGVYPRYRSLRSQLERLWTGFIGFLEREDLGTPQVTRCENSYVNYIDIEALMREGLSFVDIFPIWEGGPVKFLEETATLSFNMTLGIPGTQAQVEVGFRPTVNIQEKKQLLQLLLTTIVVPTGVDSHSVLAALDLGHDWNIRAFKEFTSLEVRKKWGAR